MFNSKKYTLDIFLTFTNLFNFLVINQKFQWGFVEFVALMIRPIPFFVQTWFNVCYSQLTIFLFADKNLLCMS